jgi:lipopolysaccharide/colanic/teichoic acid biosynthesis glycosyltransferase
MYIFYKLSIFILLLFSLPVFLVVSLLIVVDSGLPIIFMQKRVGKNDIKFKMYKFRTMQVGADKIQASYIHLNEADGPSFKIHNDPRFTKIGRFLSHTGLDELPQLYNILKGEMSFIGPRPLPVAEAAKLSKFQQKRQQIKPGIISPWILDGYHSKTFSDWMKSDLKYIQSKNLITDTKLILKMAILMVKLIYREIVHC